MTPDQLCELENSNLRKCLAWAGQHLTREQKLELVKMIQEPLEEGGVSVGLEETEYQSACDFQKAALRAAHLLQRALEAKALNSHDRVEWFKAVLDKGNWFAQADATANALMELELEPLDGSLYKVRNTK